MTRNEFICTYCIHKGSGMYTDELVRHAINLADKMEALVPDIFDKPKDE